MQASVSNRTQHAVWLDFETYYDDEYSLRRMSPIEYILDPRFEALGCAFIIDNEEPVWVDGPDLPDYFRSLPWADCLAVSHNALFDMLILSLRYGVVPGAYGDTLSMARNLLSHKLTSLSLASIAEHYGMAAKMLTVNKLKGVSFEGLRWMTELHDETKVYACDDARKCQTLFMRWIREGFPKEELKVIDWVIRMVTQPQLEFDQWTLAAYLGQVKAAKQELLSKAALDADNVSSIMSDAQLASKLLFLGANIPMKVSKTTGREAYAFAKTDKEFLALLEHPKPMVQALVAARLGHKSTMEETRTERLLAISRLTNMVPVPLKYSGAHTHRFSGDWKINLQNLLRGGQLRYALKAPKGKIVVAVDASQIEARFNAALSRQEDLLQQFRDGEDVYSTFAEGIYGYEVNKYRHPKERFVGKTAILSLGYGSSWMVFQNMCRVQGDIHLTDSEATSIVFLYRQKFKQIVANWRYANDVVLQFLGSTGTNAMWGPLAIERQALLLPDGNRLRYRDLGRAFDQEHGFQWTFMRGAQPQKIYGAKVVENACQALAFVFIKQVAMRIRDLTNGLLWPAHQVHDELVYVVDEHLAEQVSQLVVGEMSTPPVWMPGVPLAAEAHIGASYGHTK